MAHKPKTPTVLLVEPPKPRMIREDDDTTEGIDFEYKGKLMGVDIVVYDDETIEQQLMEYSYSFAISSDREPKILKVI